MARAIKDAVLTVLSQATIDGYVVQLGMQLERKLYEDTNKVLEALGGKWNRKAKGHLFEVDPVERLDTAILTGEYADTKKEFGFFRSQPPVVERLMKRADVKQGHLCLEPSAGNGAIADALVAVVGLDRVVVVEYLATNRDALEAKGYRVRTDDFLSWQTELRFDRIVMNPPFAKQADIDHVTRAYRLLNPYGRLVSVMAAGVLFRGDKKATKFRELVERSGGAMEELPDESFKASGTSVRTVMVTMEGEGAC